MNDITRILSQIESGDPSSAELLLPLVYEELRKLAAAKLAREEPGQTLQPTVLVHEAYVRLVDTDKPQQWSGRGHFFGAAAEAMRRILIENARRKSSQKRSGNRISIDVDELAAALPSRDSELLALDEALSEFEQKWPEKAELMKLRYFAGLTIPEASQVIGVSTATAERYWRFTRAWLHSRLKSDN